MASERKCCVRGCEKTREENNVVLHKFPHPDKDADRFRTWAFSVGGDIISLDDHYVYQYRRVCHEHFEHKYLTWSKMLTKNAVPTLHLKGFVIQRNPLIDITNREGPSVQDLNAASTSGAMATPISTGDQRSQNKDVAGQGSMPPKDHGILPEECKDTADILLFFDDLFDSLNGSYNNSAKKSGKVLLQALTPRSKHQETWNKSKKILKSMKFVTREGKVSVVPSITNWLRTLENVELLKNKLFDVYNIKSIWCRHLNQDPIENFFGSIRSHGYRNNSPTCSAFESAFVSLLVSNVSSNYSPHSNCEEDSCFMFKSLKTLFFKNMVRFRYQLKLILITFVTKTS